MTRNIKDIEHEIICQIDIAQLCFSICDSIDPIPGRRDFLPFYYNLNFTKGILALHSLLTTKNKDNKNDIMIDNYISVCEKIDSHKEEHKINSLKVDRERLANRYKLITPWSIRNKCCGHLDKKFRHSDFTNGYIYPSLIPKYLNLISELKSIFCEFANYENSDDIHTKIKEQSNQFLKSVDGYKDSLFKTELPLIKTNEELKVIQESYPNFDPHYIACACIKDRREKFDRLWKVFKKYADNHFLNEIYLKGKFHQRSWEMYVGNILDEAEYKVESLNEGPDFVIAENSMYVECVAATKGDKKSPYLVPESQIGIAQDVPIDKMLLRITNVIEEKAINKYREKWRSKKWFKDNTPFIIAINTSDLNFPQEYLGIPLVIHALFGYEYPKVNKNGMVSYSWSDKILKGNTDVPVTYFSNKELDFVSGVIFSDTNVLNHPKKLGDDCIFVNNPFAANPVNSNFASLFKNWKCSLEENEIILKKLY